MQSDFERVFAFRVSVSNNQRQFDSDDPEVQPIALSGKTTGNLPGNASWDLSGFSCALQLRSAIIGVRTII